MPIVGVMTACFLSCLSPMPQNGPYKKFYKIPTSGLRIDMNFVTTGPDNVTAKKKKKKTKMDVQG